MNLTTLIAAIQSALKLVQADASKQLLPLFKTMILNIAASPADLVNATLQVNSFLTQAAALLPGLQKELAADVGAAIIAWADATAGVTPPAA